MGSLSAWQPIGLAAFQEAGAGAGHWTSASNVINAFEALTFSQQQSLVGQALDKPNDRRLENLGVLRLSDKRGDPFDATVP